MFCNTVQLWGVMRHQFPSHAHLGQMFIEHFAQIFSFSVRVQDFNCLSVKLGRCSSLVELVGLKSLVLDMQEEDCCIPGCTISEGDEIFPFLARGGWGWSPHIGMHFIFEILDWWVNSDFGNG